MDKNNTTIAKTLLCFLRRFRLYPSGYLAVLLFLFTFEICPLAWAYLSMQKKEKMVWSTFSPVMAAPLFR